MKTLYLLRHAKSDWKAPARGDFERPLAPRGQMAAPRMGQEMARLGLKPALVLCSTARRAQETYGLIVDHLPEKHSLELHDDLYMAPPIKLKKILTQQSRDAEGVMMIGHNPGMEALAQELSGSESDKGLLASLDEKYPTAALAVLTFPIDHWRDVKPDMGRLTHFIKPRELED